jgi:hypothetical protein
MVSRQSWQDAGAQYYEQQYRQRKLKSLKKQAIALGVELTEVPIPEPLTQAVSYTNLT